MYKSKLQMLCQQNSWSLPEYSTTKDGPDHNPRFTATVTVNGVPFETTDQGRTAKEAQNKVAKLAFDRFSAPDPVPHPQPQPHPHAPQPLPITALPSAPVPTSSSGCPASITDLNIRSSIGGTSQPTTTEIIPTPLVNETPLGVKDDKKFIDVRHMFKNLLQNYAQKRNLPLPEYSCEREGPSHASRFKSKVTIDGKTYESPEFFPTIKEAEHAAAKVAWESFSLNEVQEDDSVLYKNLLQKLAQKEGFYAPKYETTVSGPPHMPTFLSIVEAGGRSFQGRAAKSKKQAEMNAAKVAYAGLQEQWLNKDEEGTGCSEPPVVREPGTAGLIPTVLPSGCQIKEALKVSSSILQSVITGDVQQSVSPKANLVIQEEQDEEYMDASEEFSSTLSTVNAEATCHHSPALPPEADINAKRHKCSPSSDNVYACLRDPFPSSSSPEDGMSSPSMHSECSINPSMDSNNESPVRGDGTNTLPRENILVYPRVPNMTFPDGATVLPFSDDKWVALKMNSGQQ